MIRQLSAALLVTAFTTAVQAQGPIQRAGQALDNAGQNIRNGIEDAVTRRQITTAERELLTRVESRIGWDKQMVGSTLQVTVQADRSVILRGSVADAAAKKRAIDLAESTQGVTAVVDQLVLAKDVKVIVTPPVETRVVVPANSVIVPPVTEVVVPAQTKVIVKP